MSELKLVIDMFVRENGGANRLIYILEAEWCKSFNNSATHQWSESENLKLLSLYNQHTNKYIAIEMNKTLSSVEKKIQRLREKTLIQYRKTKTI